MVSVLVSRIGSRNLGDKRRPNCVQNSDPCTLPPGFAFGNFLPVRTSDTRPGFTSKTAAMRFCKWPSNFIRHISLASSSVTVLLGLRGFSGKSFLSNISFALQLRTNPAKAETPCHDSLVTLKRDAEASKLTRFIRFVLTPTRLQPRWCFFAITPPILSHVLFSVVRICSGRRRLSTVRDTTYCIILAPLTKLGTYLVGMHRHGIVPLPFIGLQLDTPGRV